MLRNRPRATVTIFALFAAACGASVAILAAGEGSPRPGARTEGAEGSPQRRAEAGPAGRNRRAGGTAGARSRRPEATAAPGTALYHAQSCARYLGPIPAMSCREAQIVPITVGGVEVVDEPETCDRPAALTGGCQPGNAIGLKQGTHHDGRPRPEVVFMNFCRDGGMGVIGHNTMTGATCFFHMSHNVANTELHPGSNDPGYEAYWQTPDIVAADQCQGCHQADPFIHSP